MIALPYTAASRSYDPEKETEHFNSTGEVIPAEDVPPFHEARHFHLNEVPLGKALALSKETADLDMWSFSLTTASGSQKVYHGYPTEARNARGGARIEGVVSLSTWAGQVARKPCKKREYGGERQEAQRLLRRAGALIGEACQTQAPSDSPHASCSQRFPMTRRRVQNELSELSDHIGNMGEVEPSAPRRTDRPVFW